MPGRTASRSRWSYGCPTRVALSKPVRTMRLIARAAALIDRVLEKEPESVTAHAMAGVLAVEAGRCGIAIEHFRRSGAALDANTAALTEYGGCLLRLDRAQEAVPVLEQALRASPD